jgi:hypothetical protein
MDFHERKHNFKCSCCGWGWQLAEGLQGRRGLVDPPLCLTCAEHAEQTGKENFYQMLHDHDVESRRRYQVAIAERDQMRHYNGNMRRQLDQKRVDLDKAIEFLDTGTADHWLRGPGEGCCCGKEHCAAAKVRATDWVSARMQKRRGLKGLAS